MPNYSFFLMLAVAFVAWSLPTPLSAAGDAEKGARAFLKCAACHSAEPDIHKTGPSLADIWGRRAGTVEGFVRYSEALQKADVVWNEDTLDAWLRDPQVVIPDNRMTMRGISDGRERQDIIAYLERLASQDAAPGPGDQAQGMGAGMTSLSMPDLKTVEPAQQVMAIRYCGDTYSIATAAGETVKIWEFNLRFKTDSSENGPASGRPALLPAGMMGDRASVIFASPREIGAFVEIKC